MSIDRIVLAFAGVMTILSVFLHYQFGGYWLWFTIFIGANLLQSAFTGFCPLATILKMMGVQKGAAF